MATLAALLTITGAQLCVGVSMYGLILIIESLGRLRSRNAGQLNNTISIQPNGF